MIRPEFVPAVKPARLRPQLHDAEVARVVDEQLCPRELLGRADHLRPPVGPDLALAQIVAVQLRLGRDEALGELRLRHLEREQRHGLVVVDRSVLGDVDHEGALSHRGPRGEHDQVAALEAARDVVEVAEARRRADQRDALARDLLELVELVVEDRLDRAHLAGVLVVGDLVHRLLGLLDQVAGLALDGERLLLDVARGVEQTAQERVLLDDLRVVARVPRRRDEVGERVHEGRAARLLELARAGELLGHRERVDRVRDRLLLEPHHRPEDQPVALAVEVLRAEPDVDQDAVERLLGQQDRPQHRGLRLEVVRRDAACGFRWNGDSHRWTGVSPG